MSELAPKDLGLEEPEDLTVEERAELTEAEPDIEPVSYTGTDFDAEGLVRRLNRNDIVIPSFGHGDETLEVAGFQRGFVWRKPQMDRFIESLLLGFPIPGIMFVQQTDKRYLVLDGQQRLRTLAAYYGGVHQGKEFALENVADEFVGLTYKTLDAEQRRQLDNTFIQATIVKTDGSRESLEAVYQVFERLNSGGTQLTPHEIRIALYPGKFVDLLARMNNMASWRALYGPVSPRLRDQELVLRTLALYIQPDGYYRPLKKFLNDFLGDHRDLNGLKVQSLQKMWKGATSLLAEGPGRRALRFQSRQVNAALTEALLVGLMRRLAKDSSLAATSITTVVDRLTADENFTGAIAGSTATEENVRTRLDVATRAFGEV
jgi:hypothetical protein